MCLFGDISYSCWSKHEPGWSTLWVRGIRGVLGIAYPITDRNEKTPNSKKFYIFCLPAIGGCLIKSKCATLYREFWEFQLISKLLLLQSSPLGSSRSHMSSAIDFSWKIKLCFRRNTVKIKLWCNTVYWKTVAFSPLCGNHMVATVPVWHHMSPPQRSFDTIFHRCFIILPSSSWKSLSSYIIFLSLTAFKNYDMLTPIHQILATIQNFGHKKARSLVCRKATNPDQKNQRQQAVLLVSFQRDECATSWD